MYPLMRAQAQFLFEAFPAESADVFGLLVHGLVGLEEFHFTVSLAAGFALVLGVVGMHGSLMVCQLDALIEDLTTNLALGIVQSLIVVIFHVIFQRSIGSQFLATDITVNKQFHLVGLVIADAFLSEK